MTTKVYPGRPEMPGAWSMPLKAALTAVRGCHPDFCLCPTPPQEEADAFSRFKVRVRESFEFRLHLPQRTLSLHAICLLLLLRDALLPDCVCGLRWGMSSLRTLISHIIAGAVPVGAGSGSRFGVLPSSGQECKEKWKEVRIRPGTLVDPQTEGLATKYMGLNIRNRI